MTDPSPAPKPRPRRAARAGPKGRAAMARRLQATVEKELPRLEAALTRAPDGTLPEDAERAARVLASLAKTLAELRRLDAASPPERDPEEGDADGPTTLAALRDELARRLDRLR